ncbi:MAG: hypothetical protein K8R99_03805 [Actinomycetia bacterium]|nr:hypothetical protein [Actinomycetes bacterium]
MAAGLLACVAPTPVSAGDDREDDSPPISATGADVVDIRNTSGGLTRYTTIPGSSIFRTRPRGPCGFTASTAGRTYDGQDYAAGQQVSSTRWLFIEAKFQHSINSDRPDAASESFGALSQVGRVFEVYCDTTDHHIDTIIVYPSDPMLDPRVRVTNLYNQLQLIQPTVYRNPVVDRWGGLITRYPAWLAIQPAAWAEQVSTADYYRGWTLYLYLRPTALSFQVVFTPKPEQPSPEFNGIVECVTDPSEVTADTIAFPAVPVLPDQSEPGVNGNCMWTPPGPGTVTIQARITYDVTFWANGYTEALPDYTWTSEAATFATGELSAVNTNN